MTRESSALVLLAGAALLLSFKSLGPPDAKPGKLRVFLLAGQSNMEGQAVVDLDHEEHYNGGRGTLAKLLEEPEFETRWGWVRDGEGEWQAREDVGVWYRSAHEEKKGPLSIGYAVYGGRHHFGPELALGKVLGDRFDDPVLLVKACWGGKSLHVDFRPPSAGGEVGPYFGRMFEELDAALTDVGAAFPEWKELEPVVEGFVWFQGWNDGCDDEATRSYAGNLERLIGDVREQLSSKERRALTMVEVEGRSYRDTAAALEIRLENLKMVIFRGRRKIYRGMEASLAGLQASGDAIDAAAAAKASKLSGSMGTSRRRDVSDQAIRRSSVSEKSLCDLGS